MNDVALLIDAKNMMYRAVYAGKADRRHTNKYHYFVIFLRQLSSMMNIYRPSSVHMFWDAKRSTVWRKKILKSYKDRSNSTYVEDISEDLFRTTAVAKDFFNNMGVRQYSKKEMEADDLIYAAVTVMHPKPTVIVSTDSDLLQIPYNFSSCKIYNQTKQEEIGAPEINPAYQKAITGDKSDAIDGYYGIGPKKSADMLRDLPKLKDFLDVSGRNIYHRNLLLIDLSLNPKLLHNKIYVQKKLSEGVPFDEAKINKLIMKHKVNGLLQEYSNIIPHFKTLTSN